MLELPPQLITKCVTEKRAASRPARSAAPERIPGLLRGAEGGFPSRWATWAGTSLPPPAPAPGDGVAETDRSTQLSPLLTPLPFLPCTNGSP